MRYNFSNYFYLNSKTDTVVSMLLYPHSYLTRIGSDSFIGTEREERIISVALCNYRNFAALSTEDGKVLILNSHGRIIGKYIASDGRSILKLVWKPKSPLLTCGSLEGVVASWAVDINKVELGDNIDSSSVALHDNIHSSEITRMLWSNHGLAGNERLLTVDRTGHCCIWKDKENTCMIHSLKLTLLLQCTI